jgi:hypothetical protein
MSANASKPKSAAPVVVLREEPSNLRRYLVLFVPAVIGSVVFHAGLLAAFVAYLFLSVPALADPNLDKPRESVIEADSVELGKPNFDIVDEDPAARERDTSNQNTSDRKAKVTVPGAKNPNETLGFKDGDPKNQPLNVPTPGGFGDGQGGSNNIFGDKGPNVPGMPGGGPGGLPLQDTFKGRGAGATRDWALRTGGGTTGSELAVGRGLKWLVSQQLSDGRWMLNSPNLPEKDRGAESNDVAATALGLLPFLAAGKTHKAINGNTYDKVVDKGLKFLLRSQDPKTGYFGVSMYAHGLATIAMCEAYGLSQDPLLRRPAQNAVNLLVNTQHEGGGWRYGPARQRGDLSISGWQMMALKSAQMAGIDVPTITIARAKSFLNASSNADEGYSYIPGTNSSPRMTAVGLLCRQYMENWGPSHPRMIKAIQNQIKQNPPDRQDVYYYYYATQVMHHFGGEEWKTWNEKMREYLIKKQDSKNPQYANFGSWSPEGDEWGRAGGRLMMTSLNLLTLEVYYRYLPLYYRDAGYKMDPAVQKAL